MRVLLVGADGRIGRRYKAILKMLKVDVISFDDPEAHPREVESLVFDKAIIAAPTDLHYAYSMQMARMDKQFLVEKPLSKSLDECMMLGHIFGGYVVNNYDYVCKLFTNSAPTIEYDYYNTGDDGMEWDCCQLLYLDPDATIKTESPLWKLRINGSRVHYDQLEDSYVWMVRDFLAENVKNLWTLRDGRKMSEMVYKRMSK